ncbi:proline racemase [Rubrobacter xylanophilus DSM 9941]|uniref:Proline racemase n=1 Tax=Rubrobacter xylanophilus (strain DSM 9941 / JCM 11954 / NBRC 16129 / PRD-1) TaxID=266117 RepID=Q1ATU5_RUBXD|nr:proline racemase [Rubrobacter xylanophilus DSM 9941]
MVSTVDYHTAGEPFRIVSGGIGAIPGKTVLDKREWAIKNLDHVRRFLVYEPRGHADMYGCFVTDPDDTGGDLGVLFFHNAGFSTACGHGTIALATWAIKSGLVIPSSPETRLVIDTPSGRLPVVVRVVGERPVSVRFRNVPSFVHSRNISVMTSSVGEVLVDISFGGAFYASVDARSVGLTVEPTNLNRFIELGREIKTFLNSTSEIAHPLEPRLRGIYGTIFFEDDDGGAEAETSLAQRNVTVFADGQVDRSPCGSGTSARLALLHADGLLAPGETLDHAGIVGTRFKGRVVEKTWIGNMPAVATEVEGNAQLTGYHQFILKNDDPLDSGFLLR